MRERKPTLWQALLAVAAAAAIISCGILFFDGADAVHTHMTNSRLTDPEVLEWRYPVRVEDGRILIDTTKLAHRSAA